MNTFKKVTMAVLVVFIGLSRCAYSKDRTFDFKDPKSVNSMSIVLDSLLEPIMGVANDISGKVTFDPAKPESMTGSISVQASSISLANPIMTKVLHSADWIDVEKHPVILFNFKEVKSIKKGDDNIFELEITGDFICRGISREMKIPVTVSYLKNRLIDRNHKGKGDLLTLRSKFLIDRTLFGIKPDAAGDTVAKLIEIRVGIVGMSPD